MHQAAVKLTKTGRPSACSAATRSGDQAWTSPARACVASGTALGRVGREAAERAPESALGRALAEKGEVTGEVVTDAARAGDETAREVDSNTMGLQYLEMMKHLGEGESTKWIIPMDLASMAGTLSSSLAGVVAASGDGADGGSTAS